MLNIHWFCDKLNLTGSKPQLYNGLLLIFTFFSCRIVWGPIQSFRVFRDVFDAYRNPPVVGEQGVPVPLWLALVYLGSNTILNCLNYYWFGRMIDAVRKRFTPGGEKKVKGEAEVLTVSGTEIKVNDGVGGRVKKEL